MPREMLAFMLGHELAASPPYADKADSHIQLPQI